MEGLRNRNKGNDYEFENTLGPPKLEILILGKCDPYKIWYKQLVLFCQELVGIIDQDGNGIITFNEFVWFSEK